MPEPLAIGVSRSARICVRRERAVVDADLVDRAVEPLGPDGVAADAQRAARDLDRAGDGHARDLARRRRTAAASCRRTSWRRATSASVGSAAGPATPLSWRGEHVAARTALRRCCAYSAYASWSVCSLTRIVRQVVSTRSGLTHASQRHRAGQVQRALSATVTQSSLPSKFTPRPYTPADVRVAPIERADVAACRRRPSALSPLVSSNAHAPTSPLSERRVDRQRDRDVARAIGAGRVDPDVRRVRAGRKAADVDVDLDGDRRRAERRGDGSATDAFSVAEYVERAARDRRREASSATGLPAPRVAQKRQGRGRDRQRRPAGATSPSARRPRAGRRCRRRR